MDAASTLLPRPFVDPLDTAPALSLTGYPSPATIQGHNMPNRVVLSTGVKAGNKFQIAVFGINGPISMAPANTVWFRQATMEFYK